MNAIGDFNLVFCIQLKILWRLRWKARWKASTASISRDLSFSCIDVSRCTSFVRQSGVVFVTNHLNFFHFKLPQNFRTKYFALTDSHFDVLWRHIQHIHDRPTRLTGWPKRGLLNPASPLTFRLHPANPSLSESRSRSRPVKFTKDPLRFKSYISRHQFQNYPESYPASQNVSIPIPPRNFIPYSALKIFRIPHPAKTILDLTSLSKHTQEESFARINKINE